MNVIGIDYQQTLSVISLLEENNSANKFRSVGDGLRDLIPNSVYGESYWGSIALQQKPIIENPRPVQFHAGPWLDELDASLFWQHLYQRMYSFLGWLDPIPKNNYQQVVSIQSSTFMKDSVLTKRFSEQAGFKEVEIISSTDALLSRWLVESQGDESVSRVIVIAVGDVAAELSVYQKDQGNTVSQLFFAADPPVFISQTGLSRWTEKLTRLVVERLNETVPPDYALAMRDAAIEFGLRLKNEDKDQALRWVGPFSERMYTDLSLTWNGCESWLEVEVLNVAINRTITNCLPIKSSDRILVGGVGALWPFARQAAETLGTVWQSHNPEQDFAIGAASWPTVGRLFIKPVVADAIVDISMGTQQLQDDIEGGNIQDTDLIPPWER